MHCKHTGMTRRALHSICGGRTLLSGYNIYNGKCARCVRSTCPLAKSAVCFWRRERSSKRRSRNLLAFLSGSAALPSELYATWKTDQGPPKKSVRRLRCSASSSVYWAFKSPFRGRFKSPPPPPPPTPGRSVHLDESVRPSPTRAQAPFGYIRRYT